VALHQRAQPPYGPTPTRGQARQEHVSTKSLGKGTCYQAARSRSVQPPTPSLPSQNTALSRRRSENSPRTSTTPHLLRTTPPPQTELFYTLYSCIMYYYLYLLCVIVFYLTPVLIRFVKLHVCRDLYTTRAACI